MIHNTSNNKKKTANNGSKDRTTPSKHNYTKNKTKEKENANKLCTYYIDPLFFFPAKIVEVDHSIIGIHQPVVPYA